MSGVGVRNPALAIGLSRRAEGAHCLPRSARAATYGLQGALMRSSFAPPSMPEGIRAEAKRQRLDGVRLLRDIGDPAIRALLEANTSLARDLAIDGTPALVTRRGAHLLPQTRTLDGTLRPLFKRWHPGLANDNPASGDRAVAAT